MSYLPPALAFAACLALGLVLLWLRQDPVLLRATANRTASATHRVERAEGAITSLVNRMGSLERELVRVKQGLDFVRDQFDDLVSLMPDDPCRDAEPDDDDLANARPVPPIDPFDMADEWPALDGNTDVE